MEYLILKHLSVSLSILYTQSQIFSMYILLNVYEFFVNVEISNQVENPRYLPGVFGHRCKSRIANTAIITIINAIIEISSIVFNISFQHKFSTGMLKTISSKTGTAYKLRSPFQRVSCCRPD